MNCVFCEQSAIKERTIADNELAFAFLTYTPVVFGHTLISPKRHVRTYDELMEEEKAAMEQLRAKLRPALQNVFQAEGFNYAWNEGEAAGQEVLHLHMHVLPRKAGDTGVYQYEPREFIYWKPDRSETPQQELLSITETLQKSLETNPKIY